MRWLYRYRQCHRLRQRLYFLIPDPWLLPKTKKTSQCSKRHADCIYSGMYDAIIYNTNMPSRKSPPDTSRLNRVLAEARRHQREREQTYREQALKLYPWVCTRCGREFSGARVRELTVHHKDHNHDNNPPDGSN